MKSKWTLFTWIHHVPGVTVHCPSVHINSNRLGEKKNLSHSRTWLHPGTVCNSHFILTLVLGATHYEWSGCCTLSNIVKEPCRSTWSVLKWCSEPVSLSYLLTRGVLSLAFFSYGVTDIDALITGPSPVCDSALNQATDHPNSEISSSSVVLVSVWLGIHLSAQGLAFAVSFQLVDASPATATEMNRYFFRYYWPLWLHCVWEKLQEMSPRPCFLFRCRKIIDGGVGLK